eukprot:gene7435-15211_t
MNISSNGRDAVLSGSKVCFFYLVMASFAGILIHMDDNKTSHFYNISNNYFQPVCLAVLGTIIDGFVMGFHYTNPLHAKFSLSKWRYSCVIIHIISGILEIVSLIGAFFSSNPVIWSYIAAIIALSLHTTTSMLMLDLVFVLTAGFISLPAILGPLANTLLLIIPLLCHYIICIYHISNNSSTRSTHGSNKKNDTRDSNDRGVLSFWMKRRISQRNFCAHLQMKSVCIISSKGFAKGPRIAGRDMNPAVIYYYLIKLEYKCLSKFNADNDNKIATTNKTTTKMYHNKDFSMDVMDLMDRQSPLQSQSYHDYIYNGNGSIYITNDNTNDDNMLILM